ncbi:spore coat protein [Paenibacillus hexagrammi]|uniref:Spore coat protein n=1 Tax=Paenibacillus hexagrammi TaxID=2908839 RepID=A0ABY3SCC5_9BACL|nr:spore coat protein [Paenibacillus sp. YPD9-1]UJF31634.1 spore coat protein [Paenibacillus sp. YPD9-1]
MPFGAHEAMEVHEILCEKTNMINHFSFYEEQAQNQQVKQLIRQHLQSAIQHYDQLVAYTHDYNAVNRTGGMQAGGHMFSQASPQQIQYGLRQPAKTSPQMQGRMNDEQILSSMLSCHKNSAKNGMQASLECADPNVRQMLLNGAIAANQHAYDTFLLMNQMGQYQVPTMHDHTAKTYLHTFQPIQQQPSMNYM